MLTVILFIGTSMAVGLAFVIILLAFLALDELKQGYRSPPPASNGGRRR